jgi:hypothetical protein
MQPHSPKLSFAAIKGLLWGLLYFAMGESTFFVESWLMCECKLPLVRRLMGTWEANGITFFLGAYIVALILMGIGAHFMGPFLVTNIGKTIGVLIPVTFVTYVFVVINAPLPKRNDDETANRLLQTGSDAGSPFCDLGKQT